MRSLRPSLSRQNLSRFVAPVFLLAMALGSLAPCTAADADKSSALWFAHIQPLFSQHCFKCHGEVKQKGELDLTTLPAMLKGGDSGPANIPGDPTASLVYKFVQPGAEQHMPPKDYQLSEDEIALLKMWIASLQKSGTASATASNSAP